MSQEEVSHAVEEMLTSTENNEVAKSVGAIPPKESAAAPTKLYVGNLRDMKNDGLRALFKKYGQVSDVDVIGTFAFVVMPVEAEAEEAIRELNGMLVKGEKLIVEKKKAKPSAASRKSDSGPRGGRNNNHRDIQIFVAKCKEVPDDKLTEIFAKYGSVSNVQRPRTKPDIAFVSMENFFEARKAIEGLHRKKIDGLSHLLLVQLATNNLTRDGRPIQHLLQRGETVKLFVGNLNKETSSKELGVLFERYGPVFEAAVMKDKGFGFIHMLSRESAEDAIRGLNRRDFNGANITVMFSTKKGMAINRGPGDAPNPLAGRMGSQSMAPRMHGRGMMGDAMRPLPDLNNLFQDRGVDQLLALQQQINAQLLQARGGLGSDFDIGRSSLFSGDFGGGYRGSFGGAGGAGGAGGFGGAGSERREQPESRGMAGGDDRSRYANFMGGALSPLKRGRSPGPRGMQTLSPSPKRNYLDQRFGLGSPVGSRPGGSQFPFGGEVDSERRLPAKSVPPKMMRQRMV